MNSFKSLLKTHDLPVPIRSALIGTDLANGDNGKKSIEKKSPCEKCASIFFWRTKFESESDPLRCVDCLPPPSASLVGSYFGLFQDQSGCVRMLKVDSRGRIVLPVDLASEYAAQDANPWSMIEVDVSDLVGESKVALLIENRARGFCVSKK